MWLVRVWNPRAELRPIAGLKAYITNMTDPSPEFVVGAYHQLWHPTDLPPQA